MGDLAAAYLEYKPQTQGGQGQAQKFGTLDELIGEFSAIGGTVGRG